MRRCAALFFVLSLGLVLAAGYADAAPAPQKSKKEAASSLASIEKKMEAKKSAAASLDRKKTSTSKELRTLSAKLVSATTALDAKQKEQDRLEARLKALEDRVDDFESQRAASLKRFRTLSALLLRLSRFPPGLYLFDAAPLQDHFHRALLLKSLLPYLKSEGRRLEASLGKLEALHHRLAKERRLVAGARRNLIWQKSNLDQLVRARQGLLKKTEAERKALQAQLDALAGEAKDLRQLIEKLSKRSHYAGSRKSLSLRAGLKMPVDGKIVRAFGERDGDGVASQGLVLAGASGAPIVAPLDGRVAFTGPFRGYGQIVILDHGDGRYSFLAGFGRIDADVEQIVGAGEPLGILPSAASGQKPELYFEWRVKGEAVNPRGK